MKLLLSENPTNVGRQKEVDYIKLISIVGMVIIHMWEECTNVNLDVLPKGIFHNFLQFWAGPLAAPMFMTAMGIGIPYTKNCTPKDFFKRGVHLFVLAYILNFFRDAMPYAIFSFSRNAFDVGEFIDGLLSGDILQFAGLAFMVIALFMQFKIPVLAMNCIALLMQLLGLYLTKNFPVDSDITYFLGLFYKTEYMCFPLLQWLVYPCFGILLATYLRHITDKDAVYKVILLVSATLLTVYAASLDMNGYDLKYVYSLARDVFYNQEFIKTLFSFLAILIEISVVYFIFCKREFIILEKLAAFAGKYLNNIYITQWLLVGWTANLLNYYLNIKLEPPVSLMFGITYVVLSFLITKGYLSIKKKIH